MRIIYNKYIPFGPFWATNMFGVIFCRIDKGRLTEVAKNHEYIHTLQQKELWYIVFLLWYNIEWLVKLIKYRNAMHAYRNIIFEREAYDMQSNLEYCKNRKPYSWWHLYAKEGTLLHDIGLMLGDIKDFIKEDFRPLKYLFVLLAAVALMVAQVHFDFYQWAMSPSYANGTSMIVVPTIYILIYYTTLTITLALHHELWRLRQWQVWAYPAILIAISGIGQGFYAYKGWIDNTSLLPNEQMYLNIVSAFLFRSIGIITCLCIFKWITTGRFGLYGMNRSTKYLKVYGTAFCALLPIFLLVAFTPQFLSYYPKMAIEFCQGSFGWQNWKLISLFELFYANDFVAVESMFRGALIIGLSKWLGPRTILPMILTYMSIHLGKPDLEMLSSIFGGYILGILAFRTNHLWGGIFIHISIALFFELIGLTRILLF